MRATRLAVVIAWALLAACSGYDGPGAGWTGEYRVEWTCLTTCPGIDSELPSTRLRLDVLAAADESDLFDIAKGEARFCGTSAALTIVVQRDLDGVGEVVTGDSGPPEQGTHPRVSFDLRPLGDPAPSSAFIANAAGDVEHYSVVLTRVAPTDCP